MPISVANVVFSIVYITLREINKLENVRMMIENKLRTRPIFMALKRVTKKNIQLKFYPRTKYFRQSDFVDWKKITEGFQVDNIKHIIYGLKMEMVQLATITNIIHKTIDSMS